MDVPPDDIDTWLAAQAADQAKRVGKAPAATSGIDPVAVVPGDGQ